jgi:hypothetical protein
LVNEGFPTTAGAFQPTIGNPTSIKADAFVTKLNATGTALVYSTYLGGSAADIGNGIALDDVGNAYVTGVTRSANFPTAGSPIQDALSVAPDAFVTKLNPDDSNLDNPCTISSITYNDCDDLVYSTYLGGGAADIGRGIAVDTLDNAYVTGETASGGATPPAFPTTVGAFDATFNEIVDAFIAKLTESPAPPPPPPPTPGGGGGDDGDGCFIAVAAFGSPLAPQVQLLREFRDRYLLTHAAGRLFVAAYYRVSPPLAKRVAQSEILRSLVRAGLLPVLAWTKLALWSPSLGLAMILVCPGLGGWFILKVTRRREERT